jgi:lipopolysaccharide biosynthesis protein
MVRLIAFYLPQYHPTAENDEWWGKGFTEWTNVAKAKPLFRGHYQPHVPADLGFYDLRLPEVREAQAELAQEHGLEGFCYWHYWFEGKRLLERPFKEVLETGIPDFSFCLAWANETWSRRWLGEEKEVLVKQTYSEEDDVNHIRYLMTSFADSRCIHVQGRPLFLIYRPAHLPNPQKTTDVFRHECVRNGLPEPYLLGIDAHCPGLDCRTIGFDGTVRFEPQLSALPDFMEDKGRLSKRLRNAKLGVLSSDLKLYDYEEARKLMNRKKLKHQHYQTIFVRWDSTPRRSRKGIIIVNATPDLFASGLAEIVESVQSKPHDDRLVFINAWNEWAEGNHLEPDLRFGNQYLEKIKEICAQ